MRTARGLTLIELVVVIAIVAVVTAIAYPIIARATAKAQETRSMGNLRQLHQALYLYRLDYDARSEYGTAPEMGLPPNMAVLLQEKRVPIELFRCNGKPHLGRPFAVYGAQFPSPEQEQAAWSDYTMRYQGEAVLITDTNHDESTIGFDAPGITHRGIGVYLGGHARVVRKKGNWLAYEWWSGSSAD